MSIIIRLQNLPWSANSVDIRRFFSGLSIPEGGVHIVGGEMGDSFIAFSTDEDARLAMAKDGGKIKDMQIKLLLSSRTEMMRVIEQARQQNMVISQPHTAVPQPSILSALQPPPRLMPSEPDRNDRRRGRSPSPRRRSRDRSIGRDRRRSPDDRRGSKRDRSRSPARSSRGFSREGDRRSDRFKRDDRHYDDSRYRDDRRSSRDPPEEPKKYPDADHVNSRSQLHEGFRDTQQPAYDQMQNVSAVTGIYPYGNQIPPQTALKNFNDSYSRLHSSSPVHISQAERSIPKPSESLPISDQKQLSSGLYPQEQVPFRSATFDSIASSKGSSIPLPPQQEVPKPRRRTRFEPEIIPPSNQPKFNAPDLNIPKAEEARQFPGYNAERSHDNYSENRSTWPREMSERSNNESWNDKRPSLLNPPLSNTSDFLQAIPMDLDTSPADVALENDPYQDNIPSRGAFPYGRNNASPRNEDIRRGMQNRGSSTNIESQNREYPIHGDNLSRGPLLHDNLNRGPLMCDNNLVRGLPMHSDNHSRGPMMHEENRNRGTLMHDDDRNRGTSMHEENRERHLYNENQNRTQPMHKDAENRGSSMYNMDQSRGPQMHTDSQSRGLPMLRDMQDRVMPMHRDIQDRMLPMQRDIQDRQAMQRELQDRVPMMQRDIQDRAPMMQRDMQDRGPMMQRNMQDRGPMVQGNMQDRGPMVQGNMQDRGPMVQRDVHDRGPPMQRDIQDRSAMQRNIQDRRPAMQRDIPDRGPTIQRDIPERIPLMQRDVQDRRPEMQRDIPDRESSMQRDIQDRGSTMQKDIQDSRPAIQRDIQNRGSSAQRDIQNRGLPMESNTQDRESSIQTKNSNKMPVTISETQNTGPVHPRDNQNRETPINNDNKSRGPLLQGEIQNKKSPVLDDISSKVPPSLTVEVKGMPPDARIDDVLALFHGITLPAANIRIEANEKGFEKAFIRFTSAADFEEALNRNRHFMQEGRCELVPCPAASFDSASQSQKPKLKPRSPEDDLMVQMHGLPFACKEDDVIKFFDGLTILDLFIELSPDGRASGAGYVEFGSEKDFRAALAMNGKMIAHRYISVSVASKEIMAVARGEDLSAKEPNINALHSNNSHPQLPVKRNLPFPLPNQNRPPINQGRQPPSCVFMKGLPEGVTNRDIADFLGQVNIMPRAIHIMLRPDKMPSGEAYAEFATLDNMEAAVQMSGKSMAGNRVFVQPISFYEMSEILGRPVSAPPPSGPGALLRTPGDVERPRRPLIPQGPGEGAFRERPRMELSMRGGRPLLGNMERPIGRPPFGPNRMRGPWPNRPRQEGRFPPPNVDHGPKDFGSPGCVVAIKNLHFRAGLEELLDFFQGYNITKDNIIRKYNESGQTTGEARIALPSPRDAQKVVQELNQKPIMGRPLTLTIL